MSGFNARTLALTLLAWFMLPVWFHAQSVNVLLTINLAQPQPVGTPIVLTGTASGSAAPYSYRFWVQPWNGSWSIVRDWNTDSTYVWTPSAASGYNLGIEARSAGSTAAPAQSVVTYVVTESSSGGGGGGGGSMSGVTLTTSVTSPQPANTSITLTATGTGGTAPYSYRFWVQPWNGSWSVVRDWGTGPTYAWNPSVASGHNVAVEARSAGATSAQVEDRMTFMITGTSGGGPMSGVTVTTSLTSPQPANTPVAFTASGRGGAAPYSYRFLVQSSGAADWSLLRDWSTEPTAAWTPRSAGNYQILVDARSAGASVAEVHMELPFVATGSVTRDDRFAEPNWRLAGLAPATIPIRTNECTTLLPQSGEADATARIQRAIDDCHGGVVRLGEGEFRVGGADPATGYPIPAIVINHAMTLRGAGPGRTTIRKGYGGAIAGSQGTANGEQPGSILIVGPRHTDVRFVNDWALDLAQDAQQGSDTVRVRLHAGDPNRLRVGQLVEIAEDQFFTPEMVTAGITASCSAWIDLPPNDDGSQNAYQVWSNDRIVWPWYRHRDTGAIWNVGDNKVGQCPPDPVHGGPFGSGAENFLVWFNRGKGYMYGEVKEVMALSDVGAGQVLVRFTTPFSDTYRMDHRAQLAPPNLSPGVTPPLNPEFPDRVEGVGIEDLTLAQGSNSSLVFFFASKSWATNVEVTEHRGRGAINIAGSHKIEVSGSYVHDALHPYPGGGGYSLAIENNSSEILVTNSIFLGGNKCLVVNAAGAGSVFSYNYCDDTEVGYDPGWVEVGANGSHMGGSHHMLFEGNLSFNFDSDNVWGSSYSHTVLRNHFTGFRRKHLRGERLDVGNRRAIGLNAGARNFSFLGNVLGLEGLMTGWLYEPRDRTLEDREPLIWKLGYDPSTTFRYQQQDRVNTLDTTVRDGNFDYLTMRVDGTGSVNRLSFYRDGPPPFFGSCRWPWVAPTDATPVSTLPAKARLEAIMNGTERVWENTGNPSRCPGR